jgi:hypothetical protein
MGWGIAFIRKDSILDHELGIRATRDLVERGEKGWCGRQRKNKSLKSAETRSKSQGFKEYLEK